MLRETDLIKDEDIILEYIPIKNKPNEPNRGVKLKHIPTGIEVEYNKSISSNINYIECLYLLEALLLKK